MPNNNQRYLWFPGFPEAAEPVANCNSMLEIVQLSKCNNSHWFSPETRRFFKCRVQNKDPYNGCIFVSSEKNYRHPRKYSVRVMLANGSVRTYGAFEQFLTYASAHAAARALATEIQLHDAVMEQA
jgi:hypothetical protein